MKNRWAYISILLMTALFAGGALAGSVSLKVDEDTDSDKNKEKTRDDSGNSTVETKIESETEICTLEITVGNKAETETTCQLEWYFLSDYKSAGANRGNTVIFSSGVKELTLDVGAKVKETVEAPQFVFEKKTVDRMSNDGDGSSSKQTIQGDKYEGYVVLVKEGGKIVAEESNSSRYLKDEWLAKCRPGAGKKSTGGAKKKRK